MGKLGILCLGYQFQIFHLYKQLFFYIFKAKISCASFLWMECCHFLNKRHLPLVDFFQVFCFLVQLDMRPKQMLSSHAVHLGSWSVTGICYAERCAVPYNYRLSVAYHVTSRLSGPGNRAEKPKPMMLQYVPCVDDLIQ